MKTSPNHAILQTSIKRSPGTSQLVAGRLCRREVDTKRTGHKAPSLRAISIFGQSLNTCIPRADTKQSSDKSITSTAQPPAQCPQPGTRSDQLLTSTTSLARRSKQRFANFFCAQLVYMFMNKPMPFHTASHYPRLPPTLAPSAYFQLFAQG